MFNGEIQSDSLLCICLDFSLEKNQLSCTVSTDDFIHPHGEIATKSCDRACHMAIVAKHQQQLVVPFKNQTNGCGYCLQIKIRRFGDNCAKCLTFIGYSRNFKVVKVAIILAECIFYLQTCILLNDSWSPEFQGIEPRSKRSSPLQQKPPA